jgi:hypothetical protein
MFVSPRFAFSTTLPFFDLVRSDWYNNVALWAEPKA